MLARMQKLKSTTKYQLCQYVIENNNVTNENIITSMCDINKLHINVDFFGTLNGLVI